MRLRSPGWRCFRSRRAAPPARRGTQRMGRPTSSGARPCVGARRLYLVRHAHPHLYSEHCLLTDPVAVAVAVFHVPFELPAVYASCGIRNACECRGNQVRRRCGQPRPPGSASGGTQRCVGAFKASKQRPKKTLPLRRASFDSGRSLIVQYKLGGAVGCSRALHIICRCSFRCGVLAESTQSSICSRRFLHRRRRRRLPLCCQVQLAPVNAR